MCIRKHTKYQPDDKKWRCPKCGGKYDFIIDNGYDVEGDGECEKLHIDDCCICEKCGYGGSGKVVANALMKKDNQIICPTCRGKGTIGTVKKEK